MTLLRLVLDLLIILQNEQFQVLSFNLNLELKGRIYTN